LYWFIDEFGWIAFMKYEVLNQKKTISVLMLAESSENNKGKLIK